MQAECSDNIFGRNFLPPIEFHLECLQSTTRKDWLVYCLHYRTKVNSRLGIQNFNRRQNNQPETKNSILNYFSWLLFYCAIVFHMVMPTVDETRSLLIYCKQYHMEGDMKQNFQSKTKKSIRDKNKFCIVCPQLILLSRIVFHSIKLAVNEKKHIACSLWTLLCRGQSGTDCSIGDRKFNWR